MQFAFMKWILIWCCLGIQQASAQEPSRYELVIHEIFADPTPSRGLPAAEYIEVRNHGNRDINVTNISLSNGNTTGKITVAAILPADSLMILCPATSLSQFLPYGRAVPLSPWPSLNNEGDTLVLLSPSGNVIHALSWDKGWYGNALKEEGGWSIEMINFQLPCLDKSNWSASINPLGGTPGRTNSVVSTKIDTVTPLLLYSFMPDSVTVIIVFSEPLGKLTIPPDANTGLKPADAILLPPFFNACRISLGNVAGHDKLYTLYDIIATDCVNNNSPPSNAVFGRFAAVGPNDLVINEILFNPSAGGFDYLELYNRSEKVIDVSQLSLANRNTGGGIASVERIAAGSFPLLPGEYVVITENADWLLHQYNMTHTGVINIGDMPSYPDDQGNILLLNDMGAVIDELAYDEKWHFPFIGNREGVSLERIRADGETQDKFNWHSASTVSGYGTPGKLNSQSVPRGMLAGPITISSPLISPDMDGRDDFIMIGYSFPEPGYVANVTIFDSNGIPVNYLVKNALCGIKGQFRWDGTGTNNSTLRKGHYIILTDVFNINGKTKRYRNTVGLVR